MSIPVLPIESIDERQTLLYRIGVASLPIIGWKYSFYEKGVKAGFYDAPGIPNGVVTSDRATNCTIMCAGLLIVANPSINWTLEDWANLNVWADPPRSWDSALKCTESKGLSERVNELPSDGTLCLVQGCKRKNIPSHLFWAFKHPESGQVFIFQAASGVGPTYGPARKSIASNYPGGYGITAFFEKD